MRISFTNWQNTASWIAAALVLASSQPAVGQTFNGQGPAPLVGPSDIVDGRDAPPNGTATGAIQAVAVDPVDPATIYVGAVNGGVWVTHNGGTSWTPLTDKQASLSIGSLAFDPTDPTRKTLVAGIGLTSSGRIGNNDTDLVVNRGGARTGLLYSTDGGATWSALGAAALSNKSVIGVAARGNVLLAAVAEPRDPSAPGGLYRSVDGGASFQQMGSSAGFGSGSVSALVGDGTNPNVFYAAVNSTSASDRGIYVSTNAGATWSRDLVMDGSQTARLATGPGGSVAAAIWDTNSKQIVGLKLSKDGGVTWTSLVVPGVNPGQQANIHLAVAIDPTNASIVYVAGDRLDNEPYSANAFRVTLKSDGTSIAESIVDDGTANGSTVHPDTRGLAFDAAGRLILVGDGGIYVRTQPGSSAGTWSGLNKGLSLIEPYAVVYDAISKRLVVAAQDNGTSYQDVPGGTTYSSINGGDGTNAAVNDRTLGNRSAIYTSAQGFLGLSRTTVDARGQVVGVTSFTDADGNPLLNFEPDDFASGLSPFVMNRVDPTRLAFGTQYAYVTRDVGAASDTLTLTNVGVSGVQLGQVSALAFGARDNPDALLAGVTGGTLYLSATSTPGSMQQLTSYAGGSPTAIVFDARTFNRFYLADGLHAWGTSNTGASFTDLTPTLAGLDIIRPMAVEFISNNGVNALMFGGIVNTANAQSPIAVADSDGAGSLSNWRAFGFGLPNTIVRQLAYNPLVDVLAVDLFGRGAWVLYDVTSYFPSATVLRFGLADNDSAPDASILTGARPLEKTGAGTLTIAGTASYTGSTTVDAGVLVVTGSIASSSGLTVGAAATLAGNGTAPSTVMNGTLAPGNPGGALTVAGNYTQNAGSTYRAMVTAAGLGDRLNVTGTATLGGSVSVVPASGTYGRGVTYTILNATGGVTGQYAGVSSGLPFLHAALSYNANNVLLSLAPGGFAQGGQTASQSAVGGVLDRNVASASGDFLTVIDALSQMSAGQAPGVLDQLSGQNYSGFASGMVQTAQLFMNNFAQQAGGGQGTGGGGGGRIALAEACDVACDAAPARWGAWGGALGGVGTVAGNATAHGQSFNIGGFAAGLDRRFGPGFLAGVTVGFATSTQYTQGMEGRGTSNTVQAGLYGRYAWSSAYLDALAGWAHSDNQMTRPISVPGLAQRTATGQSSAEQFFGQLEAGYRVGLGGPASPFVVPFARLQASTARQAGFTETGADSLDLNVAAQTTSSLRTVVGTQLGAGFDIGWRDKLGLVFRLGWSHEFADTARPVNASFAGAPASPFSVAGAEAPRDGAILGLVANTAIADATSVYLRYDGELAGANTSHVLSAGFRIVW